MHHLGHSVVVPVFCHHIQHLVLPRIRRSGMNDEGNVGVAAVPDDGTLLARSMLNYYCGNRPGQRNPSPDMTLVVHDLITMQLVAVIVVHVCSPVY